MAIWQFHIYLIPKQSLLQKYNTIPDTLEIKTEDWEDFTENFSVYEGVPFEDAMTIHWWKPLNLSFDALLPIVQSFGDLQEWTKTCDGLKQFGDTEGPDICVSYEPQTNIVEEVSCRIDVRADTLFHINQLLSLAGQFDCLLMDSKGSLYSPTIDNLMEKIKASNAYRFAKDPRQFFDDLSKGVIQPE